MKGFLIFIVTAGVLLLASCGLMNPGDTPNSPPLVIVQNIIAVMAVSLVIVEIRWMIKKWRTNEKWRVLLGIGTLFYALHVVVYYIFVALIRNGVVHFPSETVFLTDWSTVLRFHDVGYLLSTELLRVFGENDLLVLEITKKKREEI